MGSSSALPSYSRLRVAEAIEHDGQLQQFVRIILSGLDKLLRLLVSSTGLTCSV